MDTPEIITHDSVQTAMIFRSGMDVPPGVHFYTTEQTPFQIGFHNREKGVKLTPHVHRMDKPITVTEIQELLYIISGKIKVTMYAKDGQPYTSVDLLAGDSMLLMSGGHGVEYLEDTRMFEIKQGPYPGTSNAKIYLESASHT
jgi:hypothetical protein